MAQCDLREQVVDDYVPFQEFCGGNLEVEENLWLLLFRLNEEGSEYCLKDMGEGDIHISPRLLNTLIEEMEYSQAQSKLIVCRDCWSYKEVCAKCWSLIQFMKQPDGENVKQKE